MFRKGNVTFERSTAETVKITVDGDGSLEVPFSAIRAWIAEVRRDVMLEAIRRATRQEILGAHLSLADESGLGRNGASLEDTGLELARGRRSADRRRA